MKAKKFQQEVARAISEGKNPLVRIPSAMGITNKVTARAAAEEGNNNTFPLRFCISSEAPDDWGTVFLNSAWQIDEFNKNPLVSWGHPNIHETFDPDYIIGLGPAVKEDGKLYGDYTPEPGDTNEISKKVTNKLVHGIIKKCSIYARIIDGRYGQEDKGEDPNLYYFTNVKLLLWGILPIGSNPEAEIIEDAGYKEPEEEKDEDIDEAERIEKEEEEPKEDDTTENKEKEEEERSLQLRNIQAAQIKTNHIKTALLAQRLSK